MAPKFKFPVNYLKALYAYIDKWSGWVSYQDHHDCNKGAFH